MALATIGSAWSGFQSSLWSGIQTFALADASRFGRNASESDLVANQQRSLDGQAFMEYSRALAEGNRRLAQFFHDRMRPEFLPVLDAWIATKPLRNPNAPTSPFVMPQYKLRSDQQAKEQDRLAAEMHKQARQANLTSDTYTLLVLLYTSALFLAGLVASLQQPRFKWINLGFSLVFVLAASIILFTLPIARRG
ncbi:MAG TPA: hypothetical protein VJP87_01845 [Candidatus Acidoferrales bacterium]|nr:hypothetical protein [Candidatus Acidoferrales bacterium]